MQAGPSEQQAARDLTHDLWRFDGLHQFSAQVGSRQKQGKRQERDDYFTFRQCLQSHNQSSLLVRIVDKTRTKIKGAPYYLVIFQENGKTRPRRPAYGASLLDCLVCMIL